MLWEHKASGTTQLASFQHGIVKKYGGKVDSYADLWQWSVDNINDFWLEVWEFCGLRSLSGPGSIAVDTSAPIYPRTVWFPEARLNYAENILYPIPEVHGDAIAVIAATEDGVQERVTWTELRKRVCSTRKSNTCVWN